MTEFFTYLKAASQTDIGRKRKNNEDAHGEFPSFGVWCVADGMGGGDDGEVASAAVIRSLDAAFTALPEPGAGFYAAKDIGKEVTHALEAASAWIFDRAHKNNLKGCGSTFVGAVFDASDPTTALALHVGDSRLYRLRGRDLKQITKDHSVAEMMGTKDEKDLNPMFRGMILRAVGIEKTVDVEVTPFSVKEGDIILICSDGLSRMVNDGDIAKIVRDNMVDGEVSAAVAKLIASANEHGGIDNITVTAISVGVLPAPVAAVPLRGEEHGSNSSSASLQVGSPRTTETGGGENRKSSGLSSRSRLFYMVMAVVPTLIALGLGVCLWLKSAEKPSPAVVNDVASAAEEKSAPVVDEIPAAPVKTRPSVTNLLPSVMTEKKVPVSTNSAVLAAATTNVPVKSVEVAPQPSEAERQLQQAAEELKAQRERREREEARAAELDRQRREAAEELSKLYARDEFANFANFANRALGNNIGSRLDTTPTQELGRRAKHLHQWSNDADVTELAKSMASEFVVVSRRIADAYAAKGMPSDAELVRIIEQCDKIGDCDPADPAVQHRCVLLMRAISKYSDLTHGRK